MQTKLTRAGNGPFYWKEMMRKVDVLCVGKKSVYRDIPGIECYGIDENALTYNKKNPVVAHPPCRMWSAYTRHQAIKTIEDKLLGIMCVKKVIENGGILEQPAHSRLFDYMKLPKPGERKGDLVTIAVWQAWWSYTTRKSTWLMFSKIDMNEVDIPYKLILQGKEGEIFSKMSSIQRSQTTREFAEWLIKYAREVKLT